MDIYLSWAAWLLSPSHWAEEMAALCRQWHLSGVPFQTPEDGFGQQLPSNISFHSCCGNPAQEGVPQKYPPPGDSCSHHYLPLCGRAQLWQKITSWPSYYKHPASAAVPPAICMIFLCLPTYSWYSLKTPGNKSRSQDSFPVLSPLWVRHRSGATGTWEFGFIAQRCCLIALGSLRVQILYLWMTWSKWSKRLFLKAAWTVA